MKKYCILDQAGAGKIYNTNKKLFTTSFSDYYRINFRKRKGSGANVELDFSNLFSEGRCILFEKIPKNYEYYIFIDNDIIFKKKQKINNKLNWIKNSPDIPKIIADFLDEYHPIHGTFYNEYDPIQCHLPNKLVYEKEVLRIKGFDISAVYYHHSFAKLVFPIMIHGFWSIFNFQQWICSKLYPAKLTCFTTVSIININQRDGIGGSYFNGNIKNLNSTKTNFLIRTLHKEKNLLQFIIGSVKAILWFIWHFKFKERNDVSWYNANYNFSLNDNKKYYLQKINEIAINNSFIEEYSNNELIIANNNKMILKPIIKKLQVITQNDLKKVIDIESELYQNRSSLQKNNLKYLKTIKFVKT